MSEMPETIHALPTISDNEGLFDNLHGRQRFSHCRDDRFTQ